MQRLTNLFKAIRAKGYAMQERVINPKAASISVPICIGRRRVRLHVADLDRLGAHHRRRREAAAVAAADTDHPGCHTESQERRRVPPVSPAEAAAARVKSPETA